MRGSHQQTAILSQVLAAVPFEYLLSATWQEAFKRKQFFSKATTPAVQPARYHFPFPRQSCWSGDGGGDAFLPLSETKSIFFFPSLQKASKQVFLHNTSSPMQEEASCALPTSPCHMQMSPLLRDSSHALTRIISYKL